LGILSTQSSTVTRAMGVLMNYSKFNSLAARKAAAIRDLRGNNRKVPAKPVF
jgi:hypothetical protein